MRKKHEAIPQGTPKAADDIAIAALRANLEQLAKPLEITGDTDDEFVCRLRDIKQFLEVGDETKVIYPGSSTHVGVARVFGKENVTHVDPDERALKALKGAGYSAVGSTIEDYKPIEQVDGLVALNSYGEPTTALIETLVKPGGFVVANNWTHWAAELAKIDGLKLEGAVMPAYEGDDAELIVGDKIPQGACDLVTNYYVLKPGGTLEFGTPEHHDFADTSARYPDALFIFKRES